MARNLLILLTILSAYLPLAQPLPAQEVATLADLIGTLERNAPALEGTPAETARLEALEQFLDARQVPLEAAPISTGPTAHTFADYLLTTPLELPSTSLLVVVPAGAPPASHRMGVRVALESALRGRPIPVLFIGGTDRAEIAPAWIASRLSGLPGEHQVAILDFATVERNMLVEAGTLGDVAPFYMLEALGSLSTSRLRFGIAGNRLQLARLGLSVPEQPVGAILTRGIPAVQLTTAGGRSIARRFSDVFNLETRSADPDLLLEAILDLGELLPSEAEWERNYAALQAGPVYLLLGEGALLVMGGVVLISILLYGVSRPSRVKRYTRTMRKNLWQLPLLYGAIAVYLFAATLLIDSITYARSFPTLWTYAPMVTFAAKLLVAITLFGVSHEALRKALFSQNSSFYSGWALFLHLLALIVLLIVNLALSFYFVWTFALTFLFGFVRYPWLKRFLFVLALLPPLFFVFTVLEPGENRIAELLITSPTNTTLFVALLLLPYLLMLFRLDLLRRAGHGKRMAPHTRLRRATMALLGFGALGALIFYDPFGAEAPIPVTLREVVAENHSLSVAAPRPIPSATVRIGEGSGTPWPERNAHFSLPLSGDPEVLSLGLERREFLGRTRLRYTLTAPEQFRRVEIGLFGVAGLTIHESEFPVVEREGTIQVIIGANPPNPLEIELVVEGSEAPSLDVTARLARPVSRVGIASPEEITVAASATVRRLLEPPPARSPEAAEAAGE